MIEQAVEILNANRLMSLATVSEDGWPHCSMVGFANDGLSLYFVVSRASRKFANIGRDDRVSLVVGRDVINPASIRGLSITARASEVVDEAVRKRAIGLLLQRRPALKQLEVPQSTTSAVMLAKPETVTILDYSKGFGHTDRLVIKADGTIEAKVPGGHDWGYGATFKPLA
jgi:nitroimidazol reductase NimA-like FMN-containing flavoprotein (pyridoxamine 5'-phosphate oxidase superfamily)